MNTTPQITIIEAVGDRALLGQHFRDLETWRAWLVLAKAIFGLPMSDADMATFNACTGREIAPTERAREAWLVVGRRGGKSRFLALIAVFVATMMDWQQFLAPGERGYIVIIAADRRQCRTIINYIRAFLLYTPLLAELVERETTEEIALKNGVTIEVATCSFRTIRGRTIVAALCDEAAFWADDSGANPATEVITSIRPAMSTIPGALLLVASSPYWKRGPLYDAYRRYFGKPSPILVWQASSETMNPTLSPAVVAEAYEQDPASAAAEYGAEFRSDFENFIAREAVEAVTVRGRLELPQIAGVRYFGFIDPSGGANDSMTMAIAHVERDRRILDLVRERRPPFSPEGVTAEFASTFLAYGIKSICGDRYGGEWPREAFRKHGIGYVPSELPKSALYLELLPLINSGRVELLDLPRLSAQLCALERHTARSGRDSIDHPAGGHDDLINAVAGAIWSATSGRKTFAFTSVAKAGQTHREFRDYAAAM